MVLTIFNRYLGITLIFLDVHDVGPNYFWTLLPHLDILLFTEESVALKVQYQTYFLVR